VQVWESNVAKGTLGRPTTDGEVEELGERYFGLALGVSRGCGFVESSGRESAGVGRGQFVEGIN
jgi:hypothetical protein